MEHISHPLEINYRHGRIEHKVVRGKGSISLDVLVVQWVDFHWTTQQSTPEDRTLHGYHSENLKSSIVRRYSKKRRKEFERR
jgi:hypothetical protein